MGIETAILAGLNVASAIGNYNAAKSEARTMARAGEIQAQNRADEIKKLAAKQRVSYLNAGLELSGTPEAVVSDTYQTGIDDVNAIIGGANQTIKNNLKKARANLLGGLAQTGVSLYSSGALNGLGNTGIQESGGGFSSGTVNGVYKGGYGWTS